MKKENKKVEVAIRDKSDIELLLAYLNRVSYNEDLLVSKITEMDYCLKNNVITKYHIIDLVCCGSIAFVLLMMGFVVSKYIFG
jgi:hypothetical protein